MGLSRGGDVLAVFGEDPELAWGELVVSPDLGPVLSWDLPTACPHMAPTPSTSRQPSLPARQPTG